MGLGFETIDVPRGTYTLALEHVSGGTVHILSARFEKTWSNAPELAMLYESSSGILGSPSGYARTADAIMQGVMEEIGFHLVYCNFFDSSDDEDGFDDIFSQWNGFTANANEKPHWLYLSRPALRIKQRNNFGGAKNPR